jgi:hypothetical protein
MEPQVTAREHLLMAERRRKEVVCISCPHCAGAVPVRAKCVDGDVVPVLECRVCGWTRKARTEDPNYD